MNWLRRRERGGEAVSLVIDEDPVSPRVVRRSPGGAALFDGITPDRSHSILDLGQATNSSLQFYSRYARWIRFADLLPPELTQDEVAEAIVRIPRHEDRAYDLVVAWDLLDRVEPTRRPGVMERLAAVSSPDARLFLVVDSPREVARPPLRFGFEEEDQIWSEEAEGAPTTWRPPLPAEVEGLVAPFQVVRAYTIRVGMREYVARR